MNYLFGKFFLTESPFKGRNKNKKSTFKEN